MILVVVAVAQELPGWKPRPHVEMLVTGVGPVEAASETSRALALAPPRLVINAGIGGGFRGRAGVGDALAVAREHLAELGLEDGAPMPPLPGGVKLVDQVESDAGLVDTARRSGLRIGAGLTVAAVTTSPERASALSARFDADVESMEGFAVLRAAAAAGIPAIELRGISNLVGPRRESGWDFRQGARALEAALDGFLEALGPL